MARRKVHGIFCLEGDWWGDLNKSSTVKPVLKLIGQGSGPNIPYIHRDIGTRTEFEHYCAKWRQKGLSNKYPVLYLGFHGARNGMLYIGDQRRRDSEVDLDELAKILGSGPSSRLIHFGSCETMNVDARRMQRLLRATGAAAALGFRKSVDWIESAAFEVLLFEAITRGAISVAGAKRVERVMRQEHGAISRRLGFRIIVRRS